MSRVRLVTSWDSVPVVMDLPLAARILGRTPESLKIRSAKGEFPAFKDGKFWLVTKDDLQDYIKQNRVQVNG